MPGKFEKTERLIASCGVAGSMMADLRACDLVEQFAEGKRSRSDKPAGYSTVVDHFSATGRLCVVASLPLQSNPQVRVKANARRRTFAFRLRRNHQSSSKHTIKKLASITKYNELSSFSASHTTRRCSSKNISSSLFI
jgi:hypothetical protein